MRKGEKVTKKETILGLMVHGFNRRAIEDRTQIGRIQRIKTD